MTERVETREAELCETPGIPKREKHIWYKVYASDLSIHSYSQNGPDQLAVPECDKGKYLIFHLTDAPPAAKIPFKDEWPGTRCEGGDEVVEKMGVDYLNDKIKTRDDLIRAAYRAGVAAGRSQSAAKPSPVEPNPPATPSSTGGDEAELGFVGQISKIVREAYQRGHAGGIARGREIERAEILSDARVKAIVEYQVRFWSGIDSAFARAMFTRFANELRKGGA